MMISRIAWAGTAALLIATASFDASGQELEPRAYSPSPSGMNFLGFTYLRSTGGVGVDPSLPLDNVSAAINIASLGYARTFGLLGRSASVGLVLPYARADVSGDVFEQQPDRNIRQTAQTRGIAAAKSNQDKECLALVGFAEARGNGSQAMEAVMWVVQNRHVGSKGKTGVCNVIARRGAFEGVTKPRFQPQLVAIRQGRQLLQVRTRDVVERRALREARQFAAAIVSRERTHDLTQGATHFYAPIAQGRLNRQTPSWAKEYVQTASIGGHRFFRED